MKKILMIGNGFDLAHGLPTSYKNFLKFCEIINNFFLYQTVNAETANQNVENYFEKYTTIKQRLRKEFSTFVPEPSKKPFEILNKIADKAIQDFYKMICDNIWIKYFFYIEKSNKLQEKWIDLEVEIFKVIQYLENTSKNNENSSVKQMKFYLKDANSKINYHEKSTEILEIDLRRMTRALEIYLTEFVEGIPLEELHKKGYIEDIAPDYVLSFNYTDTYSRLYDTSNNVEYDYIHGYARYNNTESTNNMVLGISESLPDESKNKDLRFVTFKKYYQRIYKKTGNKYLSWLKDLENSIIRTEKQNLEIENHNKTLFAGPHPQNLKQQAKICKTDPIPKYELYILGHSLDVTDGDIIRRFLCCNNITTTIYYLDNGIDLKEKISNLIRIIGQDELISRTGDLETIKFKPIPSDS